MLPEELKDVRPPVYLPFDQWGLMIILLLLTVAGFFFLVFWLKKRILKKNNMSDPVKSPWEVAIDEIVLLENENLPASGQTKEYFVRLSGIIRYYLERRFAVNAPEMTTDEFLSHVEGLPLLKNDQKSLLKEFLMLSDMVKFARYLSTQKEILDALNTAKQLIRDTIPPQEGEAENKNK